MYKKLWINGDKWASLVAQTVKNLSAVQESLIPGSGRFPWRRVCNPLQHSCLENLMGRGAWRAEVHRVIQSQTKLKLLSTHTHKGANDLKVRWHLDQDDSWGARRCNIMNKKWNPCMVKWEQGMERENEELLVLSLDERRHTVQSGPCHSPTTFQAWV